MATSSSGDSSMTFKDFHLTSSLDSSCRLTPTRRKCMLCGTFKKRFFCPDCIRNGQLYYSKTQPIDSYSDKERALLEIQAKKKTLEENCLALFHNIQKEDSLRCKIRQCKERRGVLQMAIQEKKRKKEKNLDVLGHLKNEVNRFRHLIPSYRNKVLGIECSTPKKWEDTNRIREDLNGIYRQIQDLAKIRIQQVVKYIFPITKIENQTYSRESMPDSEIVMALAEASMNSVNRESWEYTDHPDQLKYSVIAPTLPAAGHYSFYNLWDSKVGYYKTRELLPGNKIDDVPAYNVYAALTYTTQLVHIIAFYLNVRLPYRVLSSDFCMNELDEKQFIRKVSRLNANILYLCFTQNIDISQLKPCETIPNLLYLIDVSNPHLGRQGAIDVDVQRTFIEQPIYLDLPPSEEVDSDEGSDSIQGEWEAVPHIQCPEVPAGAYNIQTPQVTNTQQASSMAGGLVNSAATTIASMWRGFTGK